MEGLINQVNTSVRRRPSHRKRQSGEKGVHRVGSVLSDYTKPTIIRRSKEGGDSTEESEEDHVDGGTGVPVRMRGDGGSNEDGGKHGKVWHMRIELCIQIILCRSLFVWLFVCLAFLIPLCLCLL